MARNLSSGVGTLLLYLATGCGGSSSEQQTSTAAQSSAVKQSATAGDMAQQTRPSEPLLLSWRVR